MVAYDEFVHPGPRYTRSGMRSGEGMGESLHEKYAGLAMQALIEREGRSNPMELAEYAFVVADAMMAVRMKRGTPND